MNILTIKYDGLQKKTHSSRPMKHKPFQQQHCSIALIIGASLLLLFTTTTFATETSIDHSSIQVTPSSKEDSRQSSPIPAAPTDSHKTNKEHHQESNGATPDASLLELAKTIVAETAEAEPPLPVSSPGQSKEAIQQLPTVKVTAPRLVRSPTYLPGIPLDKPSRTGSRLGLTIQKIPGSVEVISSKTIKERGFTTTLLAVESAVGVTTGNCFGVVCFTFRGFSDVTSIPLLFDGNRYPGLAVPPRSTYNYENIEIIKGSSSVLHGLGSIIGSINFIPKKADGVEHREAQVSYGAWDTRSVGADLGGQVSDRVSYRLVGYHVAADKGSYGFADRTSFEDSHLSGELAMDVTADLRASASIDAFRDRGEGYFGIPLINGKIDKQIVDNNYNIDDDRIEKNVIWSRVKLDWRLQDGIGFLNESYMNYEKREWKNYETYEFNATTGLVDRGDLLRIDHDQRIYGNRSELTIDRPIAALDNKVLVGVDFSYNRHQRDNNSPYRGGDSVDFLNPTPGFFNSLDNEGAQRRTKVKNVGLYIDDFLHLTKTLKLALSYRHDISKVKSFNLRNNSDFRKTYHGNSWRVGTLFDILPKVTIYGQWSGAEEPPTQITTLPLNRKNFDLRKSQQWEVGVKGSFFNDRVQTTVAFYDLSRKNLLTRDTGNADTIQQIGKQSSQGMEFTLAYLPTWQWEFNGNLALTDSQYDRFVDNVGGTGVSRKGNRPNDVPSKTANAWVTYKPTIDWRIAAGMHYVGKRFGDRANTVELEEYVTFNAAISVKYGPGELSIHGRNLGDKLYANRSYNGGKQALIGEPRAWEAFYRMNF